ncbi:MAG TPA: tetratricopeptide repeat protein [Bryobacteraceae bacterium]|nr:tetratricopeptide repeat protein [Bryobacteraceae bacterium]
MSGNSIDAGIVRAEMDKILATSKFQKTKVLGQLLQFLGEHAIAGGPPLDEETIAAKVFGRKENFVAQLDPIVPVQFRRLRGALAEYYEADGRGSQLMLSTSDDGFSLTIVDRAAVRAAQRRRKPIKVGAALGLAGVLVCVGIGYKIEKRREEIRQAAALAQKGQQTMVQPTPANAAASANLFQQAIEEDSDNEAAWSGLASALIVPGSSKDMSRPEALQKAHEAAAKAVSLNATDGMAHAALAYTKVFQEGDWPGAEAEYKAALQSLPNDPRVHAMYAQGLMSRGRFDEAIAQAKLAASLRPAGTPASPDLAEILAAAGRFDDAIAEARRVVASTNGSPSSHLGLGIALAAAGHYDQAIPEYQAALMVGHSLYVLARLGFAYGASGDQVAAQGILNRLNKDFSQMAIRDWTYLALVYAGLGEKDKAVLCLENGYANHEGDLIFIGVDPAWDGLHSDARFIALKKRMGLP